MTDATNDRTPHPSFAEALAAPSPILAVELRPPRSGLTRGGAMDTWIDLSHSIRRLTSRDAPLLLTDSAVGQEEEENLQHLAANVAGEVDPERFIPFLTCKHSLEYCLVYAERARARGLRALTVVGGDEGGPPRCVPHAYLLRQEIRRRVSDLALGGWVNPHADAELQAGYAAAAEFGADYLLSQIVSHHDLASVECWLDAAERRDVALPTAFGVFFYRNGRLDVLRRLAEFFPVPVEGVAREFEAGVTAEEHCAKTIVGLRGLGIRHVYICNLGARNAGHWYERILREVDRLERE